MPVSGDPFTVALSGDVMLGRLVNQAIANRGFAYPWGDTLPLLRNADLVCINLECALTSRTQRWGGDPDKPFFFRAEPDVSRTLELGNVRFASLANNHILDFDTDGLLDTVAILDRAGIAHAGAGADIDAARTPALLPVGAWKVAILAFADYPEAWCANGQSPGMCFTPVSLEPGKFGFVEEAIGRAREEAELVIVSIHWGPNMRLRPPPLFRDFAHRVINAGADILWGHSAHLLQGIEIVDGRPILYDTGDFIDDYAVDPALRNDLGALFLLRVAPPSVERIVLVPTVIRDMQATLAAGDSRALVFDRMRKLCGELGTPITDEADGLVIAISHDA